MTKKNKYELSNVDITVCVLYLLGGVERLVDEEDIAMKCYELFPIKFSWEKYPEYPDSAPARFGLGDAAKEKNGQLVKRHTRYLGQHKKKEFMLTQTGIEHAKKHIKFFNELAEGKLEIKSDRQETKRYFYEMEKYNAYKKFMRDKNCEDIETYEFTDFLRCSLDSSSKKILERFDLIRNKALDNKHNNIVIFLDAARLYYKELFP